MPKSMGVTSVMVAYWSGDVDQQLLHRKVSGVQSGDSGGFWVFSGLTGVDNTLKDLKFVQDLTEVIQAQVQ